LHEKKVEKFYSTGSKRRKPDYFKIKQFDDGFLSFGYWKSGRESYLKATRRLLDFVIKNSGVKKPKKILNVACGYGTETFAYYNVFKPKMICGVDITKVHMDYANNRAKAMGVDRSIVFKHGDACRLDFPVESFSHVIGVEGPAHFNTREKFFRAANKVLEKKGELLLTDIILGPKFSRRKLFHRAVVRFVAKYWVCPRANWTKENEYIAQLKKAGFDIKFFKKIGKKVFPGYARNGFTWRTFRIRLSQRGFFATFGLTFISYMLGFLYKRGYMEYVYVKAQKC
jgi:ubiquinone/menaquinone biosynthesis C-methylase UbiE